MADLYTTVGREWLMDVAQDGATIDVLLYDDSTDAIGESDSDPDADITTEPDDTEDYERQSTTVSSQAINSDYGFLSDTTLTFNVSSNTETVDAAGFVVNFDSDVGGAVGDYLVAVASLTQTRDLSQFDQIEIDAGDLDTVLQNPA